MCKQCGINPVYEFTNKRKLCARCFVKWFQKKVLYTIRKFGMIKNGETIGCYDKNDFRSVVLRDVLDMFGEKAKIKLRVYKAFPPTRPRKQVKIAIPSTLDLETCNIINSLINIDIKKLKEKPVEGRVIKPLYLFLDKEVLLYAKLRKLSVKFPTATPTTFAFGLLIDNRVNSKKSRATLERATSRDIITKSNLKNPNGVASRDKISKFINELETKHPEIKNAVVKGWLKVYNK